jgi:hypothetical protein
MKKRILVILVLFSMMFGLFASTHLSVPLGHRVYTILSSAETRGIIDPISTVRPYTRSVIVSNLKILLSHPALSTSEQLEVQQMLSEFEVSYEPPQTFSKLLQHGSYASYWDEYKLGVAFGIEVESSLTHSLTTRGMYDSRNSIRAYMKGDMFEFFSFQMDFDLLMDRLDSRLFLLNDFTFKSEGKYDSIFNAMEDNRFYYGQSLEPEISLQFLDGNLQLRWASIQRDWGVGRNNLMISGSARSFEGIETAVKFAPWLNYQFITGSLGKFQTNTYIDIPENKKFFDNYFIRDGIQGTQLNNNFSAHRVEVNLPWNLSFGIYESVVYRKRFELAYLNPLSILMFQQINVGDFDNMFAGVDAQWRIPGVMRLYGAMGTTEMNDIHPNRFFKAPRNVMAFQAGTDIDIPIGNFSMLTVQYTNLGPFFYTHYPVEVDYNDDGEADEIYEVMYVNKGQNLGYPLRPNSDEILISGAFGFGDGWDSTITAKYQRRSGQYGSNMSEYMIYRAADAGAYDDKNFNDNVVEKVFGLELTVSKSMKDYPISFSASYILNMQTERDRVATRYWVPDDPDTKTVNEEHITTDPNEARAIPIQYTPTGPWSPLDYTHAVRLGVRIWR